MCSFMDLKVEYATLLIGRDAQAPEEPAVIVMDNASYHSRTENKLPKLYWKKELILQYMEEHEILDTIEGA